MNMSTAWDAKQYQQRHSYVFQYGQAVLDLLTPQKGERILDLGCGSGQLTAAIADAGAAVIGIDSSPEMLAEARELPCHRIPFGRCRGFRHGIASGRGVFERCLTLGEERGRRG